MDFGFSALEYEARYREVAERVSRATAPRVPTTTRRHLLSRRLRRFADRPES